MNDDVATSTALTVQNEDLMRVMESSIYPGASREMIALVLSYCRVHGLDPLQKPVHIVRMKVKTGYDRTNRRAVEEYREVLMPGIADYRIKAARSGQYGGKSEPEFGPVKNDKELGVSYPEWCRVTVKRIVAGAARDFPAKEYWLENYANDGHSNKPNYMWKKRPFGQIAKCAEAQALRMAFPELSGSQPTAEEMEGKEFDGTTIEHEQPERPRAPGQQRQPIPDSPPVLDQPSSGPMGDFARGIVREKKDAEREADEEFTRTVELDFANAKTATEVTEIKNSLIGFAKMPRWMRERIEEAEKKAVDEIIRGERDTPADPGEDQ